MKFCFKCGQALPDIANFCPICGAKQPLPSQESIEEEIVKEVPPVKEEPIIEEQPKVEEPVLETPVEEEPKEEVQEPEETVEEEPVQEEAPIEEPKQEEVIEEPVEEVEQPQEEPEPEEQSVEEETPAEEEPQQEEPVIAPVKEEEQPEEEPVKEEPQKVEEEQPKEEKQEPQKDDKTGEKPRKSLKEIKFFNDFVFNSPLKISLIIIGALLGVSILFWCVGTAISVGRFFILFLFLASLIMAARIGLILYDEIKTNKFSDLFNVLLKGAFGVGHLLLVILNFIFMIV